MIRLREPSHQPPSPLLLRGLTSAVGGHRGPVAAPPLAEPPRPVLRQVDHDVAAAAVRTDPQPAQFTGADDVDEGHRGLDRHPGGEGCIWWRGMQVVVPRVVPDQLWKGARLAQEVVDDLDDLLLAHLPDPAQPRSQVAYRAQLGLIVLPGPGPAPGPHELIERGEV